jgi:hypothetical protein
MVASGDPVLGYEVHLRKGEISMKARFRVWLDGRMVYPDSENKPCEFLIAQDGRLVSFPNKMDETYDPVRFEHAVYMLSTGVNDRNGKEIYEGDIFDVWERGKIISPRNLVELADFLGGHYYMTHMGGSTDYEVVGNKYENAELLEKDG